MVLLLALLVVLLFFGLGFALHVLWVAAVVLLVLWLVGFALGRGESAGITASTAGNATPTPQIWLDDWSQALTCLAPVHVVAKRNPVTATEAALSERSSIPADQ